MPRASILQADRQCEGAPVVGEAGGREGRRTEHAFDIMGKTVAFRGDPQHVGVQLAVQIFIMYDSQRIPARRDIFKVAPRLRLPHFDDHDIRGRAQYLRREPLGRLEQRAIHRACAVTNVLNLDVNTGTGGLGRHGDEQHLESLRRNHYAPNVMC
jgi:hypothetical protein